MSTAGSEQVKHEYLPDEQKQALRKAVRWQLFTIGYTICTIAVVALVMGNSQAMKTAWVEDMLSLLPQLAFLVSILVVRRKPTRRHPYGWHRAVGVGHLIAGVALLAVGGMLGFEAVSGLVKVEKATIGTLDLFGHTVWLGWLAIAVMVLIIIGPLIYGPAKLKLAPTLHNKILFADADMAKADWHTNAASIVGVLGIGLGLWWLDGAAATFIALGIMSDGVRNAMAALADLMDQRARTVDGKKPHPLAGEIVECARSADWVADAAVRVRDEGQVLHAEVFVKPKSDEVTLEQVGDLVDEIIEIDWKVHDVVVVPTGDLPDIADDGRRGG